MQSALLVVAIGGGDVKIHATTLLIGYRELIDFPFLASLCSGALTPKTAIEEF